MKPRAHSAAIRFCILSCTLVTNAFITGSYHFRQQSRHTLQSFMLQEGSNSNSNERLAIRPGSTVALVTPFDAQTGKVDTPSLIRLLEHHIAAKTDNLCILGTTGESGVMSLSERQHVLETAVSIAKNKMPIIAGTGSLNPVVTKEMTQQALDLGCDAALVVTPYYVKPPQRALITLFTQIADMGLPVVIYNVPGRTACNIMDETIATCAQHNNIVGLKDATGDMQRIENLLSKLKEVGVDDFMCMSGDDSTCLDYVLRGGKGCISVTANVAAEAMHDMFVAALAGDSDKATAINEKLNDLHTNLFLETSPMPVKWAVQKLGLIPSAYCRPPLDILDPQFESQVEAAMRRAAVL